MQDFLLRERLILAYGAMLNPLTATPSIIPWIVAIALASASFQRRFSLPLDPACEMNVIAALTTFVLVFHEIVPETATSSVQRSLCSVHWYPLAVPA